jgi:hypothetical protein
MVTCDQRLIINEEAANCQLLVVFTRRRRGTTCSRTARWKPQQKILGAEVRKVSGRGKDRFRVRDLLADARCNQPLLDFLYATEVGRRALAPVLNHAKSEASVGSRER